MLAELTRLVTYFDRERAFAELGLEEYQQQALEAAGLAQ
jgi:hypothetical protein